MQSTVIVLLKLLLATVTAPGTSPNLNLPVPPLPGILSPAQEVPSPETPPPTREEIDIARHREITSKAVSAILLLLLKWFKASRRLRLELADSRCS
jgi:hypothetical protein